MKLRHKKPLNSYRADRDDESSELREEDLRSQNLAMKKYLDPNYQQISKTARTLVNFIESINDDYKSRTKLLGVQKSEQTNPFQCYVPSRKTTLHQQLQLSLKQYQNSLIVTPKSTAKRPPLKQQLREKQIQIKDGSMQPQVQPQLQPKMQPQTNSQASNNINMGRQGNNMMQQPNMEIMNKLMMINPMMPQIMTQMMTQNIILQQQQQQQQMQMQIQQQQQHHQQQQKQKQPSQPQYQPQQEQKHQGINLNIKPNNDNNNIGGINMTTNNLMALHQLGLAGMMNPPNNSNHTNTSLNSNDNLNNPNNPNNSHSSMNRNIIDGMGNIGNWNGLSQALMANMNSQGMAQNIAQCLANYQANYQAMLNYQKLNPQMHSIQNMQNLLMNSILMKATQNNPNLIHNMKQNLMQRQNSMRNQYQQNQPQQNHRPLNTSSPFHNLQQSNTANNNPRVQNSPSKLMDRKSCNHINIAYSIYLSKLKEQGKLQKEFKLQDIDPTILAKQMRELKKNGSSITIVKQKNDHLSEKLSH